MIPLLTLTAFGLISFGLWRTRTWGQTRWRWLVWPQIAAMLFITQLAYLGQLPLAVLAIPLIDKVLHFLLFGMAVFWLNLWLGGRVWRGNVPLAFIVPLGLATLEELLQGFSAVRSLDLFDWLCDVSGMLLGWWWSARVLNPNHTPLISVNQLRKMPKP
jgi:VanZ family protein